MTLEQVAAVLGLDEDDGSGTGNVVVMSPEERPFIPRVGKGARREKAAKPAPEFL